MDKFQRSYVLTIGPRFEGGKLVDPNLIVIKNPFTLDFEVNRNTLASANTGNFRIYNLSENNRKKIFKDTYRTDIYIPVNLKAGYGTTLPTIFKGNIRHAWSVRESTNYITTIDAFDGGDAIVNGFVNKTFKKGTAKKALIKSVLDVLPNVTVGAIGDFAGEISRGNSVNGNASDIASTLSNDGFFIDLEKAYCLNDNECVLGSIAVISSDTGLLGTPIREQQTLSFDMLFEPRVLAAQKISLNSITAKNFNGTYKVISIKHHGTISEAVCGDAITSLGLWAGDKELTVVTQ